MRRRHGFAVIVRLCLVLSALGAPAVGQSATKSQGRLILSASRAQLGSELVLRLQGTAGAPWMIGVDRESGVTPVEGTTLWLGLSSQFSIPYSSASEEYFPLNQEGVAEVRVPIPNHPGLEGQRYYLQAAAGDRLAPGGWAVSNALSVEPAPAESMRTTRSELIQARSFHQATPLANGGVLVSGGGSGPLFHAEAMRGCETFDPYTRSWSPVTPMLIDRKLHTATPLKDGRIFVCGGVGSDGLVRSTSEIYDPTTDIWTLGPRLRASRTSGGCPSTLGARVGHQATRLSDGRVLITGGSSVYSTRSSFRPLRCFYRSASRSAEIFDPKTNTTKSLPRMGEARTLHQQILRSDGTVLIVGGISDVDRLLPGDVPIYTSTIEMFDPTSNTFSFLGYLSGRIGHSLVELGGGRFMIVGGLAGERPHTQNSVQTYSLRLGAVMGNERLPNGNGGLAFHTTTRLNSGELLIAGGAYGELHRLRARSETWTFGAGKGFAQSAVFTAPRIGATTTALPIGLLTVGGSDGLRASRQSAESALWMPPAIKRKPLREAPLPWFQRAFGFAVPTFNLDFMNEGR